MDNEISSAQEANAMTNNEGLSASRLATPELVVHAFTRDSAEHLFAASPVLVIIANWTGRIGTNFIKKFVLAGKIKDAKRNAAIIVSIIFVIFAIIIACVIWLASLA